MKQFFKFMFASMIGFILVNLIFFLIVIGIAASVSDRKTEKIEDKSILKISLNDEMKDRTVEYFDQTHFRIKNHVGLIDLVKDIKRSKYDDKIKGIFLDLSVGSIGFASLEELRNALIDFKKSKKFLIAYAENFSKKGYYLGSVADKIYMNPKGLFEFDGFSSQITFFKGALDKLGIEPQVFRVGTFKSFVEAYTLSKMSDSNRVQIKSYLGSVYAHYLSQIGQSRKIGVDILNAVATDLKVQVPEDALKYRLVDGLKYKDEVLTELAKLSDQKSIKDLSFVSAGDYHATTGDSSVSENKIAVIYASGDIGGGEGNDNSIGSDGFSRTLRKLRMDDKIKAVVLRINSPGGGATASDVIWREVVLTRKVKPVIVSMGDVAASGGYYIACAANKIFAEPNTITGSIGIFAIIPNAQKFFNEKLGITFDKVNTGTYSDILTITRPLSDMEKMIFQKQVNEGYKDFTEKVAEGRKRTVGYINTIGQGRVWTGEQALKIGLVDKIGNFSDAVKEASAEAKLDKFSLVAYPDEKSFLDTFIGGMSSYVRLYFVKKELGDAYSYYEQLAQIKKLQGVQAHLPFSLEIN